MWGKIGSTRTVVFCLQSELRWPYHPKQLTDFLVGQSFMLLQLSHQVYLIDRFVAIIQSNLFLNRYKANELQVWKYLNSPFYFQYLTLGPPSPSLCTGNPCKDVPLPPHPPGMARCWIVRSSNKLQWVAGVFIQLRLRVVQQSMYTDHQASKQRLKRLVDFPINGDNHGL